ncbi:AAA family ATPase [Georgenia ruanii]|uniref:AAA family ATPase n=1 Tax=Georgenia ruanii TaxID=348442 RepID=UPI001264C314|nr:LuxR family transcriptional regulator [Georgenia ruanii]
MRVQGRAREQAAIDEVVRAAREGRGGALVVRGEPGAGKSVLLADAAARATGVQVLRTQGIESEAPLPFAALERLLRPVLDRADRLAAPQARALGVVLGEEHGEVDRFLVFLAALNLLAEAAAAEPVLAVVDDAHWLDDASAAALLFVARRLQRERVAVLFGAREGDVRSFDGGGLPELVVAGLDDDGVAALLAAQAGAPVAAGVAARLRASTGGNPLALVELPEVLSSDQLAGRAPLPARLPVTGGVERVFLDRTRRLSADAQRLLLVAAADDSTRVGTVQQAARALGVGPTALDEAERSGLVRVAGTQLELRHPLVRSAVYDAATSQERRAAHRALADALGEADADRRAWHRAAGTVEPDEAVVAELEQAAERARRRGGHEAAAAAYERAAELTAAPAARARRLFGAATSAWLAGDPARARALADAASTTAADPLLRADLARLRARVEWNTGSVARAHRMVLTAAHEVAPADPRRARELALFAAALAGAGADVDGVEAAAAAPAPGPADPARDRWLAELTAGLDHAAAGRWAPAAGVLRPLFAAARIADGDDEDLLPNLAVAAMHLGDDEAGADYHGRMLARARDSGAMVLVLYALTRLAAGDVVAGQWAAVEARASEALALGEETRQPVLAAMPRATLLLLAALRGDETAYDALLPAVEPALAEEPVGTLGGMLRDVVRWARGLRAADPVAAHRHLAAMSYGPLVRSAAVDRVEAALRAGEAAVAEACAADLAGFAAATGQAWAAAAAEHARALLAEGADAERHFRAALAHHERSPRLVARARTQLAYGEHLRRVRRRVDAREQLRAALATFEEVQARPWAERAAQELRASGETARRRDEPADASLTPQELQVVGLVRQGLSNREVAAQLFLSPRTIDFHLRNVFAKTGVTSRTQLVQLALA